MLKNNNILLYTAGNESSIEIIKSINDLHGIVDINIYGAHYNLKSPIRTYLPASNVIKCLDPFDKNVTVEMVINDLIDIIKRYNIGMVYVTNCKLLNYMYLNHIFDADIPAYFPQNIANLEYCLYKDFLYGIQELEYMMPITYSPYVLNDTCNDEYVFKKPNFGSSGDGCEKISQERFLHIQQESIASPVDINYIYCEYLPGEEFTVDVYSNSNGTIINDFNIRVRDAIRDGITSYGYSTNNRYDEFKSLLEDIQKRLKIPNLWFAQFKEDKNGKLKLLEINCRVSGSIGITKAVNKDYIKQWFFDTYSDGKSTLHNPVIYGKYPNKIGTIVTRHLNNRKLNEKILLVDIDGTICTETRGSYSQAEPIQEAIDIVNKYYLLGYEIIYYTARGMKRFDNDVALVYQHYYELTKNQLQQWGAKYHKIIMGKPSGTYVDNDAARIHDLQTRLFVQ